MPILGFIRDLIGSSDKQIHRPVAHQYDSGITNIISTAIGLPILILIFYFVWNPIRFSIYQLQARSAIRLVFDQVAPISVSASNEPNLPAELNLCGLKHQSNSLLCDYPSDGSAFFDETFADSYLTALTTQIRNNLQQLTPGRLWISIPDNKWAADCAAVRSPYPTIAEFNDPFKASDPLHVTYPSDAQFDAIESLANVAAGTYRAKRVANDYFTSYGANLLAWKIDISPDPTNPYTNVIELPALYVFCSIIVDQTPDMANPQPTDISIFQDSFRRKINNLGGV